MYVDTLICMLELGPSPKITSCAPLGSAGVHTSVAYPRRRVPDGLGRDPHRYQQQIQEHLSRRFYRTGYSEPGPEQHCPRRQPLVTCGYLNPNKIKQTFKIQFHSYTSHILSAQQHIGYCLSYWAVQIQCMTIIAQCSIGQYWFGRGSGLGSVRQESMTPMLDKHRQQKLPVRTFRGWI